MRCPKTDLFCRQIKFTNSLFNNPSHEVRTLARLLVNDRRSLLGGNIAYLCEESQLDPFTMSLPKFKAGMLMKMETEIDEEERKTADWFLELLEWKQHP